MLNVLGYCCRDHVLIGFKFLEWFCGLSWIWVRRFIFMKYLIPNDWRLDNSVWSHLPKCSCGVVRNIRWPFYLILCMSKGLMFKIWIWHPYWNDMDNWTFLPVRNIPPGSRYASEKRGPNKTIDDLHGASESFQIGKMSLSNRPTTLSEQPSVQTRELNESIVDLLIKTENRFDYQFALDYSTILTLASHKFLIRTLLRWLSSLIIRTPL